MKCRFKTDELSTAAGETKHTINTTDGNTIHKRLASNPLNFSHQRKRSRQESQLKDAPDSAASATRNYDTHERTLSENKTLGEQSKQSTSASKTFPARPSKAKQTEEIPDITIISDSQSSRAEETPTTADIDPELTVTAEIKYNNGNETEKGEIPQDNQTPAISSPVGCSRVDTTTYR